MEEVLGAVSAISTTVNALTLRGSRQTTVGTFNFTPTITGWHTVRLQAAGGAGGGGTLGGTGYWGGCAGEFIEKQQYLIAGTNYSYTVPGTTTGVVGNGATGGNAVFVGPQGTITAKGGGGGTNSGFTSTQHRRDANASSATPALFAAPGCMWGANGGGTSSAGGYAGANAGGTASTGGGGGSSLHAQGGTGAAAWNLPGGAGGVGAGGGGGSSNGSNGTGGNGGQGFLEFEYIGAV